MLLCAMAPCAGMMDSFSGEDGYSGGDSYASEESFSPEPVRRRRKKGKGHRRTRSRRPAKEIENPRASINMLDLNKDNYSYEDESYDIENGDDNMLTPEFIAELMNFHAHGKYEKDSKVYKNLVNGVKRRRKQEDSSLGELEQLLMINMRKGRLQTAKQLYTSRSSSRHESESSGRKMSQRERDQLIMDLCSQMAHGVHEEKAVTTEKEGSRNIIIASLFGLFGTVSTGFLTYISTQPAVVEGSATVLESCMISCALQMTECLASCAV